MTLRKNISGSQISSPFIDGEVEPGKTVDTPDTQNDGSPLIWDPAYWATPEEEKATARQRRRRSEPEPEYPAPEDPDPPAPDPVPDSPDQTKE